MLSCFSVANKIEFPFKIELFFTIFRICDVFLYSDTHIRYTYCFSFLSEKFHTLALDGVPIFGLSNRTAAYRFVTLVDVSTLY